MIVNILKLGELTFKKIHILSFFGKTRPREFQCLANYHSTIFNDRKKNTLHIRGSVNEDKGFWSDGFCWHAHHQEQKYSCRKRFMMLEVMVQNDQIVIKLMSSFPEKHSSLHFVISEQRQSIEIGYRL